MTRLRRVVLPLRVLLVLLFCALVAAQAWAVPELVPDPAEPSLERTVVGAVMGAALVVGLLCVQAVLVCTWRLLGLVTSDRIFTAGALPWVDAIVAAVVVGWLALLGASVCSYYFVVDEVSDDPGPTALLLVLLLVGAVVGLLVVVLRTLLRQATVLRSDLEAVI